MGALGGIGAALSRPGNFNSPFHNDFDSSFHHHDYDTSYNNNNILPNFNFRFPNFFKKEDEHFPRHDIECKSRKDAKDKAQEYGGGEPPEGPHNDEFGSHFHAMRRRLNKREKIPNVHFKYFSKKPFIYKIQQGDCLGKIAEKFNVSIKDLQKWNNIKNPNFIRAGDTLKIF